MEDYIFYLKLFSCFKCCTMFGVGRLLLFQSLGLLMLNVKLFIWEFQIISLILSDELSGNAKLVIWSSLMTSPGSQITNLVFLDEKSGNAR